MSVTYPDLTNDFPDIASDERYLYRDMMIDDIPSIVKYENLLLALKTAASGASSSSQYSTEWEALVAFKKTEEYKQHVEPVDMTAVKFQTLEDKTISAQRFAKRSKQQCSVTENQPESNEQAVGDIWFKIESSEDGSIICTPYLKQPDGTYVKLTLYPKKEIEDFLHGKITFEITGGSWTNESGMYTTTVDAPVKSKEEYHWYLNPQNGVYSTDKDVEIDFSLKGMECLDGKIKFYSSENISTNIKITVEGISQ